MPEGVEEGHNYSTSVTDVISRERLSQGGERRAWENRQEPKCDRGGEEG